MHIPISTIIKQVAPGISPYAFPGLVSGSVRMPSIIVQPHVLCQNLTTKAARYFGISDIATLRAKTRRRSIVEPRQIITYLLRQKGVACTEVGRFFGQDHTSILHSEGIVRRRMEVDVDYRNLCEGVASFVKTAE